MRKGSACASSCSTHTKATTLFDLIVQEEQQHEERPWRRKRVRSAHGTKAAVLQQTPEEAGRRPSLDNASSTDEGSGQRVVSPL